MNDTPKDPPTATLPPRPAPAEDGPALGRLVDEVRAILRAGEEPDVAALVARYPHLAEQVAQLVPALSVLHRLAGESDPGQASRPGATPGAGPLGQLGDYRILREVGRGGMGIVYEAEQVSLGRHVALKVLPFAAALDGRRLQRFKHEAQAAAHLHHTNIVPVFAVGCEQGVHYYAMQFIDGHTLAAVIEELKRLNPPEKRRRGVTPPEAGAGRPDGPAVQRTTLYAPLPAPPDADGPAGALPAAALSASPSTRDSAFFRSAAHLGMQAAEALEHAHDQGIVHRDVKPANLLIDVRGNLWVTDFGLARMQNDAGMTLTGDLLGTVRYMSPEQALAKRVPIDHRTDIYSLGVTLYELLTLHPAHDGDDPQEVIRQIAFEEPRPPRHWNRAVPVELETIVLKAMAKNPEERYATAQDLADDLRRFLEDKPIHARRPTLGQRLRRWSRRHRAAVVSVAAVGFLALSGLLAGGAWHTARLQDALNQTREREQEAQAQRRQAETNLYHSRIDEAEALRHARGVGFRPKVFQRLQEALHIDTAEKNLDRLRQEAVAAMGDFVGLEPTTWTDFHAPIRTLAFRPDGVQLAVGLADGSIQVRNVATGEVIATLRGHNGPVSGLLFGPEGGPLYSAEDAGKLKVWQPQEAGEWTCRRTLNIDPASTPGSGDYALALTPDGKQLAALAYDSTTVSLWNLADGTPAGSFRRAPATPFYSLALSPHGSLLAAGYTETGKGWGVCVWDLKTGRLTHDVRSSSAAASLSFSPDGRLLACGRDEGLWLLDTEEFRQWSIVKLDSVNGLTFSPDNQYLAFATVTNAVKLWSATTNRELAVLEHADRRGSGGRLAFSSDNRTLASAGVRSVRLWHLGGTTEKLTLAGHPSAIPTVAFSPDGRLLVSGSKDATVRFWDAQTGSLLDTLPPAPGVVQVVAFSPDGRLLAAVGAFGEVLVWNAQTRQRVARLEIPKRAPINGGLGFSPDGNFLAVSGSGLTVWRVTAAEAGPDRKPGWSFRRINHLPSSESVFLRCSPETHLAAWYDGHFQVCLWDLANAREVPFPGPHAFNGWHNLAFYPDGKHLAYVTQQRRAEVWDVLNGQRDFTMGRSGEFNSYHVALSRDGRWFAADASALAATLWDAQTGKRLFSLPDERSPIWCLDWSPHEDRLALGLSDGGLVIWDLRRIREHLAAIGLDLPPAAAGGAAGAAAPFGKPLETDTPPAPCPPEEIANGYLFQAAELQSHRPQAAALAYREALQRYTRLTEASPDSVLFRSRVALIQNNLAVLAMQAGRLEEAEVAYRQAVDIDQRLAAELPDEAAYRSSLAIGQTNLAGVLTEMGRWPGAEGFLRQALQLGERLVHDRPREWQFRVRQEGRFGHLGALYERTYRLKEAGEAYRQAAELDRDLAAEFPKTPAYRSNWAIGLISRGRVLRNLPEAEKAYRQALALRQQLVKEFPHSPSYKAELADCQRTLSRLLRDSDRIPEAEEHERAATRLYEEALAATPGTAEKRLTRVELYLGIGNLHLAAHRLEEAEKAYRQALSLCEQLLAEEPGEARYAFLVGRVRTSLALAVRHQGQADAARDLFRQGCRQFEDAVKASPQSFIYRKNLVYGLVNEADLQVERGECAEAARLVEQMPQTLPEDWPTCLEAADVLSRAAARTSQDARLPPADRKTREQSYLDRARDLLREASKLAGDNLEGRNALAWFLATTAAPSLRDAARAVELARTATAGDPPAGDYWLTLGAAQYRAGNDPAALEALQKALPCHGGGTVRDWLFLALTYARMGQMDEGRRWYERAVAWLDKTGLKDDELLRLRKEATGAVPSGPGKGGRVR